MSKSAETLSEHAATSSRSPLRGGRASNDGSHSVGRELVRSFYTVVKSAEMFEKTNVIVKESTEAFMSTLAGALEQEDRVCLRTASDCVFFGEKRLRFDFEGFTAMKYVVDAMKGRSIGAIVLHRDLEIGEFLRFIELFIGIRPDADEPLLEIRAGLLDSSITSISVEDLRDLAEDTPKPVDRSADTRKASLGTYFRTVFVAKQFMENLKGRRATYMKKARRLVHSVVDLVAQDESTLLALTQIKNFDDFLFTHSANVCIVSVSLGQALGFERNLLAQLGLAALLHDVGVTELPRSEKLPGGADATGLVENPYESHPALGALAILREQGINDGSIRSAAVCLDHHRQQGGGGYPRLRADRPPGLLSSIVAIADTFDRLTSPPIGTDGALTPEEALFQLLYSPAEVHDPVLVKILVNTVGVYPPGSVVKLSSGRVGMVQRINSDPTHLFRPKISVLTDTKGERVTPLLLDLSVPDPATGKYTEEIEEVIPNSRFFSDAEEFTGAL